MSKNMVKPERPQTTICWISKATCAQAHDRAQARVPTHTNTHTSTHATTYERAQTHTHTQKYVVLVAFLRQQWFRECTSILRYTYIACLVILRFRNNTIGKNVANALYFYIFQPAICFHLTDVQYT
jgi:hypothetical protein